MKLDDWFPNEEAAFERGVRVLNAIHDGSEDKLQRELGETIVIDGMATSLMQRGVGHDFTCDEIYVRVHGSLDVPPEMERRCACCFVLVRGRILGAYVSNRVLVLSVKPDDYQLIGTG